MGVMLFYVVRGGLRRGVVPVGLVARPFLGIRYRGFGVIARTSTGGEGTQTNDT